MSQASMNGKICLVTGANSGIGFAIANELAQAGATVVMVCRDKAKGEAARNLITAATGNKTLELIIADLSALDSVRSLASEFKQTHDKLNVLVNNAGLIMGKRVMTRDGLETTFEVNYLSHFLLTHLLLDQLKAGAPSRIVNVSSGAHFSGHIDFEDLQEERKFSAMRSYCQSKLAQVMFTYELSKRLQGTGISVNAVHPGAVRTHWGDEAGALGIGIRIARPFMLSPEKGAETPFYVAASPEVEGVSSKYFDKKRETRSSKESYDEVASGKLWEISMKLSGLQSGAGQPTS